MINISQKILSISLLCLLMAGCASTGQGPTPSEMIPWETRQAQLSRIQEWDLKGSVSIQYQKKTDIASINWVQRNQNYDIILSGPLNFGRVQIKGKPGSVTFKQGSRDVISASSPEALMAQQLGWQIPVSNLHYWLRGLPAPGASGLSFDAYGRLAHLKQQGWVVEYADYMRANGLDLPKKIYLNNPSLKLRIVIRQWTI